MDEGHDLASRAREYHRKAMEATELAGRYREQRDQVIRQLREAEPLRWSYGALAKAVGVSPELVAAIIKSRRLERS